MAEQGLDISVNAQYLPDHSEPSARRWFFAYRVRILNQGPLAAQVQRRHWIITDGEDAVEEVKGPGVIGEQPRLEPSQSFEYTSACPLSTPVGTMQGTYQMVLSNGEGFDAEIAPFTLAAPNALN